MTVNHNLVVKLVVISVLMFGFGYLLDPLYQAFCRVTGFGGKTDVINEAVAQSAVQENREVAVSFTSHSNTTVSYTHLTLPTIYSV